MKKESELDQSDRQKMLQKEKNRKADMRGESEEEANQSSPEIANNLNISKISEPARWETTSTHWKKLQKSG